ncbi:MAG: TonB-dependent receptor plug domain-containing protein, partial [Peristeroidobacter soli]
MILLILAAEGGVTLPASQPEIIVTGSRVATTEDNIAANVTVLDREDFDVEKPVKLADVLKRVSGVHIDSVGGRGGTGSLYMRGADPNYTLVLVDGVRVNDPTNARGGSFDFSALDVADIERVEIARGPYSAVYGGDALAGVINIVTRQAHAEKGHASADVMGGAYDLHEISLNTGGPLATGDWNMGFSDSHEGD